MFEVGPTFIGLQNDLQSQKSTVKVNLIQGQPDHPNFAPLQTGSGSPQGGFEGAIQLLDTRRSILTFMTSASVASISLQMQKLPKVQICQIILKIMNL